MLLVALVTAPVARADTRGIGAGDVVGYTYTQALVNHLPNGTDYVRSYVSRFSVQVVSIDGSTSPATVNYVLGYTESQNKSTSETGSVNSTYFFDPYDNKTYLGAIGFYPFVFTDLQPGSKTNMHVTVSITQGPNGTIKGTTMVNVTVAKVGNFFDVNLTERSGSVAPSSTYLRYNASNGILTYGTTDVAFLGLERNFIFELASFEPASSPGVPLLAYLVGIPFVALAAFALIDYLRSARRKGRSRKQFGRSPR